MGENLLCQIQLTLVRRNYLKQSKSENIGTSNKFELLSAQSHAWTILKVWTKIYMQLHYMYFFLWGGILKSSSAYSSTEKTKLAWHVCPLNMEFKVPGNSCLEYENMAKSARF